MERKREAGPREMDVGCLKTERNRKTEWMDGEGGHGTSGGWT